MKRLLFVCFASAGDRQPAERRKKMGHPAVMKKSLKSRESERGNML
jgi:hypothetical protein